MARANALQTNARIVSLLSEAAKIFKRFKSILFYAVQYTS